MLLGSVLGGQIVVISLVLEGFLNVRFLYVFDRYLEAMTFS